MKLKSAAFGGSYQPMKELLDVSDASMKVSHTISEISHATSKIIQLCLHAIEVAFNRSESPLSRGGIGIVLLRCQATNEMMIFCVLLGTSHEVSDPDCIACVAYVEVI